MSEGKLQGTEKLRVTIMAMAAAVHMDVSEVNPMVMMVTHIAGSEKAKNVNGVGMERKGRGDE